MPEQVTAPMRGTVTAVFVAPGEIVRPGQQVVALEAMKMEHLVEAPCDGVLESLTVGVGDLVDRDAPLFAITPGTASGAASAPTPVEDSVLLDEVDARHAATLDAARPEAVARRHAAGGRTARENLADLCDPSTFVEYGGLALAAQRRVRTLQDLIVRTPADGIVTGIAAVGGVECVVLAYDYTVLAGSQGLVGHHKLDRMLEIARRRRLPVILFAEGGGGRPSDVDSGGVAALDVGSFHALASLSGAVPLIGIAAGHCFAGNAALLGSCDVTIATTNSSIGMAGPAMIEGGGLGVVRPEDVGPSDVQSANGVIDVLVSNEAAAVAVAKQYLAYFHGNSADWRAHDQSELRGIVPVNRRRVYDIRRVVRVVADVGSVLELGAGHAAGMITALIRVEGRPLGLIANNPQHLGGAIDREAAEKASDFLRLCGTFGLPVVSLCDTPGFMVGPDAERTATVRYFSRLFVTGAQLGVPLCTVILRKAYGLGAMAMAGGSLRVPVSTVGWPTSELGPMGIEGAVTLSARRELEDIADDAARQQRFDELVEAAYEHGKGLNAATYFELDDVIDPSDTRRWITRTL